MIYVNLTTDTINHNGTKEGYKYDTLKIKETSGKRIYFTAIKNGIRMVEVIKNMVFEDGKVIVSFGKNKYEIGTYTEGGKQNV